jgi:hypothetical protein
VKLLDFGIARVTSKLRMAVTAARAGSLRGKCQYLAPEQVNGDPVDARSDVFALGAVLWEMLTGRQLFTGANDFEVMTAVTRAEIRPPSCLVAGLPAALDRVVMTALARNPEQRYASADQMATDLESVMRALPSRHGDLGALLGRVEAAGPPPPPATPSGNAFARISAELQAPVPAPSGLTSGFLAVMTAAAISLVLIATLAPAPKVVHSPWTVASRAARPLPVIPAEVVIDEPDAATAESPPAPEAAPPRAKPKKLALAATAGRQAVKAPSKGRRRSDRLIDPFDR